LKKYFAPMKCPKELNFRGLTNDCQSVIVVGISTRSLRQHIYRVALAYKFLRQGQRAGFNAAHQGGEDMGAEQYFHLAFKEPQSIQATIYFGHPATMRPPGGARYVIERLYPDTKCGVKRLLHESHLLIDFSFHPRVSGSERRQVRFSRCRCRGIILN
jgi:hypothetical protein